MANRLPFRRWHFEMHSYEWKVYVSIQISLNFLPKCSIDNKSALVQVMAWCRNRWQAITWTRLTLFADAYMWHSGEMSTECYSAYNQLFHQIICLSSEWVNYQRIRKHSKIHSGPYIHIDYKINSAIESRRWNKGTVTHHGLITSCGITELGHHLVSQCLDGNSTPSHYLNQCWLFAN